MALVYKRDTCGVHGLRPSSLCNQCWASARFAGMRFGEYHNACAAVLRMDAAAAALERDAHARNAPVGAWR